MVKKPYFLVTKREGEIIALSLTSFTLQKSMDKQSILSVINIIPKT